ncbi:glycosyltransferase 61 family protein [Aeromicrobium sp. NPDC092404]|uniref:glycosyltransferase family 61 protein n=1 Tax=Aeromicrobium sp. NPDC092404 TaxID=3154976 RepID=UPI0034294F3E
MTRLPSALQPAWPLVKRAHRLTAFFAGAVFRRISVVFGQRALPRRGSDSTAMTAAWEPQAVTIHVRPEGEHLDREQPPGEPAGHWAFATMRTYDVPPPFTADIADGTVVGDYGAVVTPGGTLDFETSPYFAITDWREHPLFLRRRLPRAEQVDGSVLALATRGGGNSYYHFLLDVLPRWGVFEESMPGREPDAIHVPSTTRYHRELLALSGLDRLPVIEASRSTAVRARHLLVPSPANPMEVAPRGMVEWVRRTFPAVETADKPKRIFVTRTGGRNTRRLIEEPELWPELEGRGFVRIDPGAMSVRDQIDHFAAADVIVGIHGAALTNLVFAKPGVSVLELFTSTYVKHCFWAITDSIEGASYRYLIGGEPRPAGELSGIQADISLDPKRVLAAVDDLLG